MGVDIARRHTLCIEWHCFTAAEKFGVIFTSVVVSIVLLVAWMYYLGRMTTSHRERNTIILPGGQRSRQNPNLPANVALGQLPIAHYRPGHPPQILYQPVVYNLDPQQIAQARPYLATGPYPQGAATALYPQPAPAPLSGYIQAPMVPQAPPTRMPSRPPSSQSRLSLESHLRPQRLTLQQRINQRLRLPSLRALALPRASRARETTHQASGESDVVDEASTRTQTPGGPNQGSLSAESLPATRAQQRGSRESARPSLDSNAATVHSDDYDEVT